MDDIDKTITDACGDWPRVWNGELDAHRIVAPDLRIWFGAADGIAGADTFAAFLDKHRAAHPGIVYANHGEPVVDTARRRAALTWTVTVDGRTRGGIDLLELGPGGIARVWSVTGERDF